MACTVMLYGEVWCSPQKDRIRCQVMWVETLRGCEKDGVGLLQEIDKSKRKVGNGGKGDGRE